MHSFFFFLFFLLAIMKRAMIVFGGVVEKKKGMILIRNKHVLECPTDLGSIGTEPVSRSINRNTKLQVISACRMERLMHLLDLGDHSENSLMVVCNINPSMSLKKI